MKTIIIATILSLSLSSVAKSLQNPEYGSQAILAAKAINSINWGKNKIDSLEVIKEKLTDDGENIIGTYKVRLFLKDSKTNTKSDGGKDFDVYIYGGAVLNVKVDCRGCG